VLKKTAGGNRFPLSNEIIKPQVKIFYRNIKIRKIYFNQGGLDHPSWSRRGIFHAKFISRGT
jgi:hypothetical protein